jgi:hypothetical protein
MISRFISAALVLSAPLSFFACTVERAPAASPPPAAGTPAAAPTNTVATIDQVCKPIGYWRAAGPAGAEEIKVTGSTSKPGQYDVAYKGAALPAGSGTQNGNKFTVDVGQTTNGLYNCTLGADCRTMSCGFTGQTPTVLNKAD